MRLRRVFLVLFFSIATVLIFLPPLIGFTIQKLIYMGALVFDLQDKENLQIIDYKRGWFTSEITSVIKISDPALYKIITELNVPDEDIPKPIAVVFKQHIQHGPFFYFFSKASHFFGLANINQKFIIQPNQKKFFADLGIFDSTLQNDQMLLSFTGKAISHFQLAGLRINIPKTNFIFQFDSVDAEISYKLFSDRVKGDIKIKNFYLQSYDAIFFLPNISMQFDLRKDAQGFWIGNQSISLPAMTLNDLGYIYEINDMHLKGFLKEDAGLLSGEKDLTFRRMQFKDQSMGPFHFQINAARINAKAIANLIDTYIDIQRNGELYQSQLRQRILTILPSIVTAGAKIELSKFDFMTPQGQFMLRAKLEWPRENFISPDSIGDLVKTSIFHASLRVATPLVDQFIKMLSKFSFIYQLEPEEREKLILMQKEIHFIKQQNSAAIIYLGEENRLTKEDSADLLEMVRNKVSFEDYYNQIRKLFLERKITPETAYFLDWLFASFWEKTNIYSKNVRRFESMSEKLFQVELNEYIKAGFVTKDKGNYLSSMQVEGGIIKINGKNLR